MYRRLFFDAATIIVAFIMPWWVAFIFLVIGAYMYAPWFEGIAFALFFDFVVGIDRVSFHHFEFIYTAFAIVSVAALYGIKRRIISI